MLLVAAFILSAVLAGALSARAHYLFWDDCFDGVCPESNFWDGHGHTDDMFGRGSNDILYGRGADDIVRGQAHFDILRGYAGPDRLRSGGGGDDLHGGAGNDRLVGDEGRHNHCWGGDGNDSFEHCHRHG